MSGNNLPIGANKMPMPTRGTRFSNAKYLFTYLPWTIDFRQICKATSESA